MNVTLKISDEICRAARHRAANAGCSLSEWIEEVIRKELSRPSRNLPKTLLEALGNGKLSDVEVDFPRNKSSIRKADLS